MQGSPFVGSNRLWAVKLPTLLLSVRRSGGVSSWSRSAARASMAAQSWPSFVNYVEGCFSSSAEAIEPGRGHHLPNAFLPCLGA
jgi:hypothetical protein